MNTFMSSVLKFEVADDEGAELTTLTRVKEGQGG